MAPNYNKDMLNREANKIYEEIMLNCVQITDECKQCGENIDEDFAECLGENHLKRRFHLMCIPKEGRDYVIRTNKYDAFRCKECKVKL